MEQELCIDWESLFTNSVNEDYENFLERINEALRNNAPKTASKNNKLKQHKLLLIDEKTRSKIKETKTQAMAKIY